MERNKRERERASWYERDPAWEFNGQSFRCKVKTGQEGLEDFMRQIRQKCGIPEEKMASLNLTYRCKDPNTGSQMTLEGVNESAFDAAVLCSAAQDKKKHEKRQRRLQQQQQQQQQQGRSCDGRDRRESNSSAMSTSSTEEGAIEAAGPTVSGGDPGEVDRLRQLSRRASMDSAAAEAAAAAAEGEAIIRRSSSDEFTAYRHRLREGGQAPPPPLLSLSSLHEPSSSTPPSSSADGSAAGGRGVGQGGGGGARGGMAAAPRRSYQQRFMPSFSSFSSLVRTGCLTTQPASLTTANMTTTNQ